MESVIELLTTEGGVRTGTNKDDGYFIVALGFNDSDNPLEAEQRARLDALKMLNEFVNGTIVSGKSEAIFEYVTKDNNGDKESFSQHYFFESIETKFKGQLNSSKVIKKGTYKGDSYIAITITEKDIDNRKRLSNTGYTLNTSLNKTKPENKEVVATGTSPLKHGVSQARKLALQDALRNAISQTQGIMVSGKVGTFGSALSSALSTKTQGYIRSYYVLEESKSRGTYSITIKADVDGDTLLKDVNFYLTAFNEPKFYIKSDNESAKSWLTNKLEKIGFSFITNEKQATHIFKFKRNQSVQENHQGKTGFQTQLTLSLFNKASNEVLFTVINKPEKTIVFVSPASRAQQISEKAAIKFFDKILVKEVINALAKKAERGTLYDIVIENSTRRDLSIFKLTLNNGTSGEIESWNWSEDAKKLTLKYRYQGKFSAALDEALSQLYKNYKTQGKGKKLKAISLANSSAIFRVL